MGKIRKVVMGDVEAEKAQKKRAEARRETKKAKKTKLDGVGLKGGERTAVVEGTDIKPEFKKLIEKVEAESASGDTVKEVKKPKNIKVKQRSKKYKKIAGVIDKSKLYPVETAVEMVKKLNYAKFDASVEIHININPKSIQTTKKDTSKDIRGTLTLPHGTGKQIRVAVADEKLITDVESGKIDFDILISHPSMMPKLAKVARILGPKGLMPNPKNGTVTDDIQKKKAELSQGQVNYKSEPGNPIIHMAIGKISFADSKLVDNINAVLEALGRGKIIKAAIASTMSPGIKLDING